MSSAPELTLDAGSKSAQEDVTKIGCSALGEKQNACSSRPSARPNQCFHYFGYIVIVMCGFAMGTMILLRLTVTVAMISMVNHTLLYIEEHPNSTKEDLDNFFPEDYVETGEFNWTNEVQQTIISGYMIAYCIPQFFTTRLTMRYGMNIGIPICLSICSLSCLLTPTLSYWGWQGTFVLRLLNGVGASAVLPVMIYAIELWLPEKDFPKGIALFQFCSNLCFTFTPMISGFLTSIGWKWAFYVPGCCGLGYSLVWWLTIADNPESSRWMSQKELDSIKGQAKDAINSSKKEAKSEKPSNLPWHFMFKIKVFYVLTFIWCMECASIGGFLFLLPSYVNRVLKVPVEKLGEIMFLVQIGVMFCSLWYHPLTLFLQKRFNFSLTFSRNIIVSICVAATSSTFAYLALYHSNILITICINRFFHTSLDTLVLATIMSQFGHAGVSGLIYGMMNSIGNSATVLFCWVVGRFLDSTGETLECWSGVFAVMISMTLLFLFFYTAFCPSKPVDLGSASKNQVEDKKMECV